MELNIAKRLLFILCACTIFLYAEASELQIEKEIIPQLQTAHIIPVDAPIKLHLGCGQCYLPTYVNIDFPADKHTVQAAPVADTFANISLLHFPANSVAEIRHHHVFEHFPRAEALAMLCAWQYWLKEKGKIHIETPDFEACVQLLINPKSTYAKKQIVLRHIFGSHEADWAIHCDGWYQDKFQHTLEKLGFSNIHFEKIKSKKIPNIAVIAEKGELLTSEELAKRAKTLLKESLVDETEFKLYEVWCKSFDVAFSKMIEK